MSSTDKIREHWRDVRRTEADLRRQGGAVVYIALLDGNNGVVRVVDADPFGAARAIVSGTHRLATEKEIADYVGEQKAAEAQIRAAELSREKRNFVLPRTAA